MSGPETPPGRDVIVVGAVLAVGFRPPSRENVPGHIRGFDVRTGDTPTAPILADITVDGRDIKAVAQLTKQAFVYVFDRVTGEPVWPIKERSVIGRFRGPPG